MIESNTPYTVLAINIMSDSEDHLLEDDKTEDPIPHRTSRTEEVSNADLFSLLKTYMNGKVSEIERSLSDKTENLAKKVKKSDYTFKFKGHQVQFELNTEILDDLHSAIKHIENDRHARAVTILKGAISPIKKRNKHKRIADKSEGGWKTVDEYISDEIASDSEDEKRIRAADSRAVRKIKSSKKDGKVSRKRPAEASGAPAQTAHNGGNFNSFPVQPLRSAGAVASAQQNPKTNDQCFRCSSFGHWARDCRKKINGDKIGFPRGPAV